MATSSHYVIERLNANNYGNWASDVKFLLLDKNAWDIVQGTETLPQVSEKSGITDKDVREYKAKENAAKAILYLNIDPEYRKVIENVTEASEIWKTLKQHFLPDNRARHMQLFTELCNCRIGSNEVVDLFAARITRISEQLQAISKPIDETFLTFQLLRYLPPQFDTAVQGILRWGDDKFKFKDVLIELVAEENRLRVRDNDRKNDSLIEAYHSQQRHTRSRKGLICFKCGRKGHISTFCGKFSVNDKNSPKQTQSEICQTVTKPRNPPRKRSKSKSNSVREKLRSPSPVRSTRKNKPKQRVVNLVETNISQGTKSENTWIFDSAASHHFCKDLDSFNDFNPVVGEQLAVAVDGVNFPIEGCGVVKLKFGKRTLVLDDVMYSPKLRRNLISGSRLDQEGITYKGGNSKVQVFDGESLLFTARLHKGIYYSYPKVTEVGKTQGKVASSSQVLGDMEIWHKRLGHVSPSILEKTSRKDGVKGLPVLKGRKFFCEPCKLNKQRRVSFKPSTEIRSSFPLDLLHMDVWGPVRVTGNKGEKYYLSITDDFSRKVSVYPMREKSQVFDIFVRHITRAERFLDRTVKCIRSDNGTEFVNSEFKKFCDRNGIKHEVTNLYTPEQNGVSERWNQTLLDGARTILAESDLDQSYWPEAILFFTYTWNRLCHTGLQKTPSELYGGRKPSVTHMREFGSTAYVGIPRVKRSKLDPKARKGILVGYAFRTKGYRILFPESGQIVETINVSFGTSDRSGAVMGPKTAVDPFEIEGEKEEVTGYDYCPGEISSGESSEDEEQFIPPTGGEQQTTSGPQTTLRDVTWLRKPIPRPDKSRVDIYYFEQKGSNELGPRLRSHNDVERYCSREGIRYEPSLFNFRGTDLYHGSVPDTASLSSSHALCFQCQANI